MNNYYQKYYYKYIKATYELAASRRSFEALQCHTRAMASLRAAYTQKDYFSDSCFKSHLKINFVYFYISEFSNEII